MLLWLQGPLEHKVETIHRPSGLKPRTISGVHPNLSVPGICLWVFLFFIFAKLWAVHISSVKTRVASPSVLPNESPCSKRRGEMRRDSCWGNSVTPGCRVNLKNHEDRPGVRNLPDKAYSPPRAERRYDCLQTPWPSRPSWTSGEKHVLGKTSFYRL